MKHSIYLSCIAIICCLGGCHKNNKTYHEGNVCDTTIYYKERCSRFKGFLIESALSLLVTIINIRNINRCISHDAHLYMNLIYVILFIELLHIYEILL